MITEISNSLSQQIQTAFLEGNSSTEDAFLKPIRQAAFEKFQSIGLPTAKLEEWKNTGIQNVLKDTFSIEPLLQEQTVQVDKADIPGLDAYRIVLVNGEFRADLSDSVFEEGVKVFSFKEAVNEAVFQKHFAQYADQSDNPFVNVSTALVNQGYFIHVADNLVATKPVHVVHVSVGDTPLFYQTRNLVVLGKNAEFELLETFITEADSAETLNNFVAEIYLDVNAKMEHYYIQISDETSQFLNHTEVEQQKHSLYNNYNCIFPGASFVRNNINVRLQDEQVESHLYGINLTASNQLVDNHTIVDHIKPHCESYEWYKNIIQDQSTVIFNGKIFVREDAQKTNAFQQNNNMLMGEDATVFTKPQLEIFADDVKCSHGCTIGQFQEEALFYLRSRGIGEQQAKVLMVHAFAFDVTERFQDEAIKNYVNKLIEEGLKVDAIV